jgi:hypothetical protein
MDGKHVDDLKSIDRARVPVQRRAVDDNLDDELDIEVDTDLDPGGPDAELGGPDAELDGPVELAVGDGLTERERQVLAFERQWWRRAGAKEQAIRELFGISSTRYYQLLNGLLDNGAALAYDPVLVKRLRRLRASRTRIRTAGRVA